MYQNPFAQASIDDPGNTLDMSPEEQEFFDAFYEDIYLELWCKYGDIEELNVCGNLGDHLIGNVYVKFRFEEDAEKCVNGLNNRWYNGVPFVNQVKRFSQNFLPSQTFGRLVADSTNKGNALEAGSVTSCTS